jgi:CheY-like chemotaxis protein
MDPATRERIFEPFFTTKEVGKGTGLGLSTVYGIVKQSGGIITVDTAPGQGATFQITLPRLPLPPLAAHGALSRGDALPRGSATVLLVEDEEGLRLLAGQTLRSAGYTVLEARDGQEALQIFEKADVIDLVVTDVVMPKMSGRQLAERVAALRPSTRVLYLTGSPEDTVMRHGLQAAGTALLQKPFTSSTLASKVHALLARDDPAPREPVAEIAGHCPSRL